MQVEEALVVGEQICIPKLLMVRNCQFYEHFIVQFHINFVDNYMRDIVYKYFVFIYLTIQKDNKNPANSEMISDFLIC